MEAVAPTEQPYKTGPQRCAKVCGRMTDNRVTAREFVGREIRAAREAKGLSRAALAKRFPVSEPLVAWWESGRTLPADDNLTN